MNIKIKKAFTLSEIVITLGLIGVIASLTIPAIVNNNSDDQVKLAFKKDFFALSNVSTMILSETSASYKGLCNSANCFRDKFKDKLNVIKECDSSNMANNCWSSYILPNDFIAVAETSTDTAGLILNDGSLIKFTFLDRNCENATTTGIADCAYIDIDVNGFKGPNKTGKDDYKIHVTATELKPFGTPGDLYYNTCNTTGEGCAAEVLTGGKIVATNESSSSSCSNSSFAAAHPDMCYFSIGTHTAGTYGSGPPTH